jgi:hypothetical protein
LPDAAAARLSELSLQRDAALDAANAAAARLNRLPPDADQRMRDALAGERDKHQARHRALAGLSSKANQWLMELRAVTLEPVPPISVDLRPGETLNGAIEAMRGEVNQLHRQLDEVKRAPLPAAAQTDLVEAYVVQKMQAARPSVSVLNDKLRVNWRGDTISVEDVVALLCLVAPEHVCKALERALPEVSHALPKDERLKRVAHLEMQQLELERKEESLITQAAAEGTEVLRRVDADPRAVLSVAVVAKEAQVA